jgi:hypothetical protein
MKNKSTITIRLKNEPIYFSRNQTRQENYSVPESAYDFDLIEIQSAMKFPEVLFKTNSISPQMEKQ